MKKNQTVKVRVSDGEMAAIKATAGDRNISQFFRDLVLKEVGKSHSDGRKLAGVLEKIERLDPDQIGGIVPAIIVEIRRAEAAIREEVVKAKTLGAITALGHPGSASRARKMFPTLCGEIDKQS